MDNSRNKYVKCETLLPKGSDPNVEKSFAFLVVMETRLLRHTRISARHKVRKINHVFKSVTDGKRGKTRDINFIYTSAVRKSTSRERRTAGRCTRDVERD